jgi:hypothetical protein
MVIRHALVPLACAALLACSRTDAPPPVADTLREYLYVWTGAADSTESDFLAVLDITDDSLGHGRVATTTPVPGRRNGPHHTEHEMPSDRRLFANGFRSGQSFVFDLTDPVHPRIDAQFGDVDGYSHPHSFLRLPNGNVLGTFQMRHGTSDMLPGGLVELTPRGERVRSASANAPGLDPTTRVYSAGIVPALDRIVTTTTDMNGESDASRQLQLWRLSDLQLLHTFALPDGPRGDEGLYTAEPRVLRDGRTVLVSTFSCGLYLLDGLESDTPSGRLVASFPQRENESCAIPVIAGDYYLVTVPAWSAVVSLDISDPAAPREVSRVAFGPDDVPHWIALSPDQRRVVVTGYEGMQHRVELLSFDVATGAVARDERFRDAGASTPGVRFDNKRWPHGRSVKGVPHGAVFGR